MVKGIRQGFRRLTDALVDVAAALHRASDVARDRASEPSSVLDMQVEELRQRVDALERTRATWEAEAEGLIIKAESRFSAARAAEERTRHMRKADAEEADSEGDAAEGGEEGVPAVHPFLAMDAPNGAPRETKRARATRLKYTGGR